MTTAATTLVCADCSRKFDRVGRKGPSPRFCPDCRDRRLRESKRLSARRRRAQPCQWIIPPASEAVDGVVVGRCSKCGKGKEFYTDIDVAAPGRFNARPAA